MSCSQEMGVRDPASEAEEALFLLRGKHVPRTEING